MRNDCNDVVLVSCCRTPITKFGGSLKDVKPIELMKLTANEAIKRSAKAVDVANNQSRIDFQQFLIGNA